MISKGGLNKSASRLVLSLEAGDCDLPPNITWVSWLKDVVIDYTISSYLAKIPFRIRSFGKLQGQEERLTSRLGWILGVLRVMLKKSKVIRTEGYGMLLLSQRRYIRPRLSNVWSNPSSPTRTSVLGAIGARTSDCLEYCSSCNCLANASSESSADSCNGEYGFSLSGIGSGGPSGAPLFSK